MTFSPELMTAFGPLLLGVLAVVAILLASMLWRQTSLLRHLQEDRVRTQSRDEQQQKQEESRSRTLEKHLRDLDKDQAEGHASTRALLERRLGEAQTHQSETSGKLRGELVERFDALQKTFKDPLKSELLAKAIRQQEPRGGKVDYDVKGTLAGNWFSPESTGFADFKNHFALGYNHIYGDRIEIFDGYARFSQNDYTYSRSWVKNNRPLPEEVDLAYGVVKYEMINTRYLNRIDSVTFELRSLDDVDEQLPLGVFLFEMLDTERMQAEFFPGKLADEVNGFSGNQRVYIRNP